MKLNLTTIFSLVIGAGLIFTSCKKNKEVIEETTNNPGGGSGGTNQAKVNTTIAGTIVDEIGMPISGAQVSVGTTVQFTDNKGNFIFDNINTNKERTYVKVSKPGFFDGSRIVNPFENQLTKVSVMLQSNAYDGVISGTTGGSVSLTSGAKVELPANGVVVQSTGMAYTGNVNVSMAYLDASSYRIGSLAPGDMMAIDGNGDSKVLTSYGMLNVELTGDAGEKLQVASGSQATITIPSAISGAPTSMPLWYFDIVEGIWKEDGSATLQGNNYVGNVSHFTTWNVDFPEVPVEISGYILDCNGNPFSGIDFGIRRQSNGAYIGFGYTDSAGMYHGDIPSGIGLVLNILGPTPCNSFVFSANVGPFTTNQSIPTISICNYGGTIIQGTINNSCGAPYALIEVYEQGTNNLISTPDYYMGNFTKIFCGTFNSGLYIVGESTSGNKDTIVLNTVNNNTTNNIGALNFCDTAIPGKILINWAELYTNSSQDISVDYYKTGQMSGSLNSVAVIKAVHTVYGYAILENSDTVLKVSKKYQNSVVHASGAIVYRAAMSSNSQVSFDDTTDYGTFMVFKNNLPYLYLDNAGTVTTSPGIAIFDHGTHLEINHFVCDTNSLTPGVNIDCNEYSFYNTQTGTVLQSEYNGDFNYPMKTLGFNIEAYF
jgi:hypothetical protein